MKSDLSQGCNGLMYIASEFGDYFCVGKRNRGEPVEVFPGVFSDGLLFRKDRMNIAEFSATGLDVAVKTALKDRAHMISKRTFLGIDSFYALRLLDADDLTRLRVHGLTYYEDVVARERLIELARNGKSLFPDSQRRKESEFSGPSPELSPYWK